MYGMTSYPRLSIQPFLRKGYETRVVREGYEDLVRGNDEKMKQPPYNNTTVSKDITIADPAFLKTLRFGDGTLLRDGTFGRHEGRSLRGRYIVRIG